MDIEKSRRELILEELTKLSELTNSTLILLYKNLPEGSEYKNTIHNIFFTSESYYQIKDTINRLSYLIKES